MRCCITGPAFAYLLQQPDQALVQAVALNTVAFTRMKSKQKGQLLDLLGRRGLHHMLNGQRQHIPVILFATHLAGPACVVCHDLASLCLCACACLRCVYLFLVCLICPALPVCLTARLSVCLSVWLFVCLSAYLLACLSVCPFVQQPCVRWLSVGLAAQNALPACLTNTFSERLCAMSVTWVMHLTAGELVHRAWASRACIVEMASMIWRPLQLQMWAWLWGRQMHQQQQPSLTSTTLWQVSCLQ